MAFAARKAGVGHSDPIAGTARPTTSARSNRSRAAAPPFVISDMVELVRAGLAMATAERIVAGSRKIEVPPARITEAGRKALAETR
jgi:hypothetical protein